jgi:hypothetical protein
MHKINPAKKRITVKQLVREVAKALYPNSTDIPAIRQALNDTADAWRKDGFSVPNFDQPTAVGEVRSMIKDTQERVFDGGYSPQGDDIAIRYRENPKGRQRMAHHWKTYDDGQHSGSMELTSGANPRRIRKRLAAQYAPGHAPTMGRIKQGPYRQNPVGDGINPFDRAGLEVAGVRVSAWQSPGHQNFAVFIAAAGSRMIDVITLNDGKVTRDSIHGGVPLKALKSWRPVTEVPQSLHRLVQEHIQKAVR